MWETGRGQSQGPAPQGPLRPEGPPEPIPRWFDLQEETARPSSRPGVGATPPTSSGLSPAVPLRDTHLQEGHRPAGDVPQQPLLGELVKDNDGQAEEEHQEVPEGQAGQDGIPGALQVVAVPHHTHDGQVAHDAHGEHQQRQQQDRVGAIGALGHREQRVLHLQPLARRPRHMPAAWGVPVLAWGTASGH